MAVPLLAVCVAPISVGAAKDSVAETAKKKKCGKKGKKGAAAAKKCKKGNGGGPGGGGAPAAGPAMALGEYACASAGFIASGMQVLPGNRYTVNRESPGGTYTYNPANGIVTFTGGGFGSFYGVYNATAAVAPYVEIYAAYNDPPIEYGDYYGQCGWLSGP